MEGHWKFLRGGGFLKAKFLEAMWETKPEFPGGGCGEMQNQTPSVGGGGGVWIHIFWNCTLIN